MQNSYWKRPYFGECAYLALFPAKEKATFIPSRLRVLEMQLDKKEN